MAYIDASDNPKANEQARAVADAHAAAFVCKQDKVRIYGDSRR